MINIFIGETVDSELLKTFLEVSRTRHFGKAAETLYLTQSAVSFRIRQLETQVGADLFTRHRNNIQLTEAGERLVPYAEKLMETWLLAKKEVLKSRQHKELSIGAPAMMWESLLISWLAGVYKHKPELLLEARIGQRHTHVRQLHERHLDLLITTEIPKMEELSTEKVGEFTLQLLTTAAEGASDDLPYIRLEWGADFSRFDEQLTSNINPPILTTSSIALAEQVMNQAGGRAFFPAHWHPNHFQVDRSQEALTRPIYAVWLHNSDRKEEIKYLTQSLINYHLEQPK
jgi:DNA-binding transcriptional LysR family regulator